MVAMLDTFTDEAEPEQDEAFDEAQRHLNIEQAAYREAGEKWLRIGNAMLAQILSRLPAKCAAQVDVWAAAYAVGSWICEGVGISERAAMIGVEKATLSRAAIDFCVGNDLPPSRYLRGRDTMAAYRAARLKSIVTENARHA